MPTHPSYASLQGKFTHVLGEVRLTRDSLEDDCFEFSDLLPDAATMLDVCSRVGGDLTQLAQLKVTLLAIRVNLEYMSDSIEGLNQEVDCLFEELEAKESLSN